MYFVYILLNTKNEIYIGQTNDIDARLKRHNSNRSPYTKNKGPWNLAYKESFPSRALAMKRERQLKKWNRMSIQKLLNSQG